MSKLFIFSIFLLNFSCRKAEDCPSVFRVPINLSPANLEYRVGDTMNISAKFNKLLLEYELNEYFNFENTQITLGVKCFKLDTNEFIGKSVLEEFVNYEIKDSINLRFKNSNSDGKILIGEFNYKNDSFYTKINLIPIRTGLYCVRISSFNLESKFSGQCKYHNIYQIHTKLNEGGKNNVDLLKEAIDPYYNSWMLEDSIGRFHNWGGYCFRVVE